MKKDMLNQLLFLLGPDGNYHFHKVHLLFFFIGVFLLAGIAVMIFVMYHRKKDRRKTRKYNRARARYTETLTAWLFSEEGMKEAADLFPEDDLKKPYHRLALQDVIFLFHRDFEGATRLKLRELYHHLGMHEHTRQKLEDEKNWHRQASAVREVAELDLHEFEPQIRELLNSDIPEVRAEARSSLFRLHGFKDVRFITHAKRYISDWEQIRILNLLSSSNLGLHEIPSFKEGLYSRNDSVVIFCVRLVNYFMQYTSVNDLIRLLEHRNPRVRHEAVKALSHLEATKAVPELVKRLKDAGRADKIVYLRALGELGNSDTIPVLEEQLTENDQELNLIILSAISHLGDEGRLRLRTISLRNEKMYHPLLTQLKREHNI